MSQSCYLFLGGNGLLSLSLFTWRQPHWLSFCLKLVFIKQSAVKGQHIFKFYKMFAKHYKNELVGKKMNS